MCFEQNVQVIVALTLMEEKGRVCMTQSTIIVLFIKVFQIFYRKSVLNTGRRPVRRISATLASNWRMKSLQILTQSVIL